METAFRTQAMIWPGQRSYVQANSRSVCLLGELPDAMIDRILFGRRSRFLVHTAYRLLNAINPITNAILCRG